MKVAEAMVLTMKRGWQFVRESFSSTKELVPLEQDPVGEFLEKKKGALAPDEEHENTAQMAAGEGGQGAAGTGHHVKTEKNEAADSSGINLVQKTEEPGVDKMKAEDLSAPVLVMSTQAQSEEAVSPEPATRGRLKAADTASQDVKISGQSPVEKPEEVDDKEAESLLDVFRTEENKIETLGPVSKELGDMSVYSLLEEGKELIAKIRGGRSETP